MRTEELTLPGYAHDVCSAIHPLGVASPFFRTVPLAELGVEWIESPAALAHPFDDGTAALLERSVEETGATLGPTTRAGTDGSSGRSPGLRRDRPRHPRAARRSRRIRSRSRGSVREPALPAAALAELAFRGPRARGFFAGLSAHSLLPLSQPATAAFGLMLGMLGHAVGWPFPRGGSQKLADALAAHLRSLGGEIETGTRVESLAELGGDAKAILLDVTPRQLVAMAGDTLPERLPSPAREASATGRASSRSTGRSTGRSRGRRERVRARRDRPPRRHARGDRRLRARAVARHGRERPYVLLAQPSLFDPSRAPEGKQTAWAYCHVPNGSTARHDASGSRQQVERFAPGFRDRIIARSTLGPAAARGAQREPRRRRHQRRRRRPATAVHAPGRAPLAVHDAAPERLHLLGVDPARRRRPRHVRLARGPRRSSPARGLKL